MFQLRILRILRMDQRFQFASVVTLLFKCGWSCVDNTWFVTKVYGIFAVSTKVFRPGLSKSMFYIEY